MVPPAASIFSLAPRLTLSTLTERGKLISPFPRTLIPSTRPDTRPTAARVSRSTSVPLGKPFQLFNIDDRDDPPHGILESPLGHPSGQGHLPPFEIGTDTVSRTGVLALCALAGRAAMPRTVAATDPLFLFPRTFRRLSMFPDSFPVPLNFHRSHQVINLPDHPAYFRRIIQHHASVDLAQSHAAKDPALRLRSADVTMNQCNLEHFTHSLSLFSLNFRQCLSLWRQGSRTAPSTAPALQWSP